VTTFNLPTIKAKGLQRTTTAIMTVSSTTTCLPTKKNANVLVLFLMHSFASIHTYAYLSPFHSLQSCGRTLHSASWTLFSAVSMKEQPSLDEESVSIREDTQSKCKIDAASRFHLDMRRVLKSRNDIAISNNASSTASVLDNYSPMERRKRPTMLTEDVDGAIRVTSMLRHMVNIGVATEESFQIVLEAIGARGRLRWKNKDSLVVCAADEVEGLLEEIWDRQDGEVSTETCNLALRAYAACSTPRGDRRYAQKAQALLAAMEENDIAPSNESYSHAINAWAWQQGNLEDGECVKMAQQNFEELEKMHPDDATMLQALDWILEAWSKTRSEDAPQKAEETLNKMTAIRRNDSGCRSHLPNSQSYTNAILAWAKSRRKNSAEKAQEMLYHQFGKQGQQNLSVTLQPNIFAISTFPPTFVCAGLRSLLD
jgi:hypothetical protein